jgi:hypothetical protein
VQTGSLSALPTLMYLGRAGSRRDGVKHERGPALRTTVKESSSGRLTAALRIPRSRVRESAIPEQSQWPVGAKARLPFSRIWHSRATARCFCSRPNEQAACVGGEPEAATCGEKPRVDPAPPRPARSVLLINASSASSSSHILRWVPDSPPPCDYGVRGKHPSVASRMAIWRAASRSLGAAPWWTWSGEASARACSVT